MADLHVQVSTVKDAPEEWQESKDVLYWVWTVKRWYRAQYDLICWRDAVLAKPLPPDTILALMPSPDQAAPDRYAETARRVIEYLRLSAVNYDFVEVASGWRWGNMTYTPFDLSYCWPTLWTRFARDVAHELKEVDR